MNRWLVVLLVLLAVVVLISPGIIGRLAEKNLEENIEWAESEAGNIEFKTESFDRGWFTSEGRHRVMLSGPSFQAFAEAYREDTGYDELPSLVIDTRLDHGLLPIASLGREEGTLAPGLASTVSTFRVDPGNGELVPLPGTLYSQVALDGTSDSHYLLEAGEQEINGGRAEWQGADITIQTDWRNGVFKANGRIEPFTLHGETETARFGAISVAADQVRSDYGFNIGTAEFGIDSISVESGGPAVSLGNMSLAGDASIAGERLNIGTQVMINEIAVPGVGSFDFAMDLGLNRLEPTSIAVLADAFKEAQSSADPEAAMLEVLSKTEDEIHKIITAGAEVRIDQLDVTLPQGKVSTKLIIDIPEGDATADFSWGNVLLAMTANADVRMPATLFEYVQLMNPQAGTLVTMGFLQRDGDDYVMIAEYAQGLLNVNGAPMPIPMPGM